MRLCEGTNVFLCEQLSLHTAFWFRACVYFSPCWNPSGLEPSTSYARRPLWPHMHIGLSVFGRPCIFTVLHPIWLFQPFCLLFHGIPEPWGRNLIVTSPLALNVPQSLTICSLPSCGYLHLFDHCVCFYAGIMLFLLLLLIQFEIRDGDTSSSSFIFLKIVSLFISILSLLLFPATNCLFLKFFYFYSGGNHTCHTFTGP